MTEDNFYSSKKVLVAGGTGTIGIPLIHELQKRNAEVTVVSIEEEEIARRKLGKNINYLQLDMVKSENCKRAVENQDMVFNLLGIKGSVGIGQTRVASYLIPMLRFQTNLMEAAFEEGIERFLFVGSVCSYPRNNIHKEESMWNGMPKQNDRIPGIAKRVGELLGEAYSLEYGWEAVRVVRPANVYGAFDDFNPKTAQVIPALISRMLSGENPLRVWGDGSAIRDFVYSKDVAYWMCEALEKSPPNYPINLGSGSGVTIKELAIKLRDIINKDIELVFDSEMPTGDPCRLLDIERAKEALNYKIKTSLEEGLLDTIEWYRENIGKPK